ncbi:MAG: N-formylglutamate amidohydrolase, partial [Bacteroidales bacterium]
MKLKLSLEVLLEKISKGDHFEAETTDGSVYLKIEDDVPFAGFAIHNGHNLREDLLKKCLLNDYERWYEEDPDTLTFISSLPIVLACNDSRYEYDLNRSPEAAIFEIAWGKKVWKNPLTEKQKKISLKKHDNFYKVLNALIKRLEIRFGALICFDVHSYNYRRLEKECPVFNLGTEKIDNAKYGKYIQSFLKELSRIKLPNIDVQARENEVFYGRGYLLEYVNSNFRNVLVVATEIKKIYCNELSGESFPVIIEKLSNQLKKAIVNTSAGFAREETNL